MNAIWAPAGTPSPCGPGVAPSPTATTLARRIARRIGSLLLRWGCRPQRMLSHEEIERIRLAERTRADYELTTLRACFPTHTMR
ncbi:hypothetical protein [Microbacterium sp. gxy059]|uniref:hypothetical protein n=1 Tax=Microbacterium sp. gxy059 TaxID=2957199 RepID=UPI003D9820DC